MINEVLQSINNYFVDDYCDASEMTTTSVVVDDASKFIVGQYILVLGSKMNDGVYLISAIVGSTLTLDTDLEFIAETSDNLIVCSLSIPRAVISIVAEIVAYNAKNDGSVKSESLGDYSVSYLGSGNGDDATWLSVFRKKLNPYRKTYLNLPMKREWLYDKWY